MVKKNLPSPLGVWVPALSGEDAHADAALVQVVGDDQDVPLSWWIKSPCTAQPQD